MTEIITKYLQTNKFTNLDLRAVLFDMDGIVILGILDGGFQNRIADGLEAQVGQILSIHQLGRIVVNADALGEALLDIGIQQFCLIK